MENFESIYNHVTGILETKLDPYLTYHDLGHTLYVLEKAEEIALHEGIPEEELFLLKVAALYHDIGFTKNRVNHEAIGCEIAEKDLISFGFSDEHISLIKGMIMATKIPQVAENHLEKILADADLEYMGTDLYFEISEKLYLELKFINPFMTDLEWHNIQVSFLNAHQYFTTYCLEHRELIKQENLAKLLAISSNS